MNRGSDSRPPACHYTRKVGMVEAFTLMFRNYATFRGRSNRGEYWWAVLAVVLVSLPLVVIDGLLAVGGGLPILATLFALATLVPGTALGVRRLHDIGRSGWWYLVVLVPIVGILVLVRFLATYPEEGPNRFG